MAVFTQSERVVRTVEFALPSGTAIGELDKAYGVARSEYRRRVGGETGLLRRADWARVEARDGEFVIAFDVEEEPGADARTVERCRQAYADLMLRSTDNGCLTPDDLEPLRRALEGH